MPRSINAADRASARMAVGFALTVLILSAGADRGDRPVADTDVASSTEFAVQSIQVFGRQAIAWLNRTPPAERITWGGLAASAGLGLGVLLERLVRLRRSRIVPPDFMMRYRDRLREGRLDRGKALDLCELNPSPAARVALAAIRRWGRPVVDLERGVALVQRGEVDRLRRNVGTLRRIAALAPLIGLLGTLVAGGRVLTELGGATATTAATWGPALAHALTPLTVGVTIAILALVAYDGLIGRVESLAGMLDRFGAETVDAIALATPADPRPGAFKTHLGGPVRAPQSIRVEIPDALARGRDRDRDRERDHDRDDDEGE